MHGRGGGLRRARWVTGVATMAFLVGACGGGGGSQAGGGQSGGGGNQGNRPSSQGADTAAGGGAYSMYIGEPQSLLPGQGNDSESNQVLVALYQGLIDYDAQTSQPVNVMADSITSQDQKTWTIRIKPGWKFHNGEDVTAQSYVDAWNYVANQENAQNNNYFFDVIDGYQDLNPGEGKKPKGQLMKGLKVDSPTQFTVTLTQPYSQFPLRLGYTTYYPQAKACLQDTKACNEQPIGNGPFRMDGPWQHDRAITVRRFADYKGDPAKADTVNYTIYGNLGTAFNDLRAGGLDVMKDLPPEQLAAAKSQFRERFLERPSSAFTYVGFPLYDPKFQNPKLRQAFSMAVDRQSIINAIFNGSYIPAKSLVSPVVAGSRPDPCGEACTYSPQRAKQLYDEAGGYQGTLTLYFNSGAGHDKWMEAVANNLRQNLGVQDVKFQSLDFSKYLPLLDGKKLQGPYRLAWVMDYPSPENYLAPLYGSNGSSNSFGYENAQVDQLIQQGNAARTVEEGVQSYQQAEDQVLRDLPSIPMWFQKEQAAYSEKVSNVVIDAFGRIKVDDVTVNR